MYNNYLQGKYLLIKNKLIYSIYITVLRFPVVDIMINLLQWKVSFPYRKIRYLQYMHKCVIG